jgi:hypothetical protein
MNSKKEIKIELKNERCKKRIENIIEKYCGDDLKSCMLHLDLIDLDYEARLCNKNLSVLIKTSPIFHDEIKILENKKLYTDVAKLAFKFLDNDSSIIFMKIISKLYKETENNISDVVRLVDLIKLDKDLHFKVSKLLKMESSNEK